ncbi:MAG: hypothetical protein OEN50_19170 [Deltaproteobacteria bacterium]|nr:hypothetical protein [Deltaproteobacteria bacterium]
MKKILFVITTLVMAVLVIEAVSAVEVTPRSEGRTFTASDVKGRYVFSFQGEAVGLAVVAATGVLTADGRGNITEGVRTITVNGVATTQTFTCIVTVNPNGTGSAECLLDDPQGFPPEETFSFVLHDNGKAFKFVSTTAGLVLLGSGERQ